MNSRPELLAAVRAATPLSAEWRAAVRALGAAASVGFTPPMPPRKGWRTTLLGILKSHHFTEAERADFAARIETEYASEVLYKQITQTVTVRAKAERVALKAAKVLTP